MRAFRSASLCLLFLAAQTLCADTATDLRNRLSLLGGREVVTAAFDVQLWSRATGFSDGTPESGRTEFQVRSGAAGVEFQYPPAELLRAETEEQRNRTNPELKTPTMAALREIDPLEALDLLNFAPTLLGYLQRGRVIEEKQDTYAGHPARLLTLDVDPPISKSLKRRLRDVRYIVRLWIGVDGLPVGADATMHGKARFLVLSFEHTQSQRWAFAHRGDRLVVIRHNDHMTGAGLGNRFERKLNVTVKLQ
jgi:hypothetical protein